MRVVSQNGWPVLNADATTVITAGGRSWRLARGQVANVFKDFLTRYAREVEPIAGGVLDDWSWAVRTVRGSTTVISNHASGTAVDINALDHPRGARGTYTRAERDALARLLEDFPVLRWGGTFGTTVDAMHVEVSCTPAELDTWLRTGTRPPTARTTNTTADPEDDDVVTRADIDAIAEAVWAKQLASASDPRAAYTARDRLAALDYALQTQALPVLADMDHLPADTARAVWDGYRVTVRHPQTSQEESVPMGRALGRAASVIWDGRTAGLLTEAPAYPAATTLAVDHDGGSDNGADTAALAAALAGLQGELAQIRGALDDLAATALEPVPTAVTGVPDLMTLTQLLVQTHARVMQTVGLVSGVRGALDALTVVAAKGHVPTAEGLSDAVSTAMSAALPKVSG